MVERLEPKRARPHELRRIEVHRAAAQTPVQAGRARAARMAGFERPERRTQPDRRADGHPGCHRLIGRAQPPGMINTHHAAAGDAASEHDHPRRRSVDGQPGPAPKVDTAVPRQPGPRRRIETACDVDHAVDRPGPGQLRARHPLVCRCCHGAPRGIDDCGEPGAGGEREDQRHYENANDRGDECADASRSCPQCDREHETATEASLHAHHLRLGRSLGPAGSGELWITIRAVDNGRGLR